MPNLNKVMLIGNLTRDPELKYTPSGAAVCEFGMAINRTWTKDGQKQEETCFVDLVAWAKTGEVIAQYMNKGRPLFVEGRMKFDSWEQQDGSKRSKITVVVEQFQFLGGREDGGGGGGGGGGAPAGGQRQPAQRGGGAPRGGGGGGAQRGGGGVSRGGGGGTTRGGPPQQAAPKPAPKQESDDFNLDDIPF